MPDLDTTGLTALLEAEELLQLGPEKCVGQGPLVLEIGFGRAELIMDQAEQSSEQRFLGVEVSRKRVIKAARRVQKRGIGNVRLICAPAEYLLERALPPACVHECWINCPDPWPKKRHFKRRLIQEPLIELLTRALRPGALLHLSTDHEGYAGWIDERLGRAQGLENLHHPRPWSGQRPARGQTAYEAEWLAEGRSIVYFDYRRQA